MLKTAYNIGVQKALLDLGIKTAGRMRTGLGVAGDIAESVLPGAIPGAAVGAFSGDPDDRLRNALIGAGVGGGITGVGLGHLKSRMWKNISNRWEKDLDDLYEESDKAHAFLNRHLDAEYDRRLKAERTLGFLSDQAHQLDPKAFPRTKDPMDTRGATDYILALRKSAFGEGEHSGRVRADTLLEFLDDTSPHFANIPPETRARLRDLLS